MNRSKQENAINLTKGNVAIHGLMHFAFGIVFEFIGNGIVIENVHCMIQVDY